MVKISASCTQFTEILNRLMNIDEESKLSIDRISANNLSFALTIAHDLFHRLEALKKSIH